MKQGFLTGAIRRQESINALKDRPQEPLPFFIQKAKKVTTAQEPQAYSPSQNSNVTKLSCLQGAVETLEQKKQEHLQIPSQTRRGGRMRFSTFLVILLMLLMAVIFFFGGYLYSYMHPPGGGGIATASYLPNVAPSWRQQQEVVGGAGAVVEAPSGTSYLQRRALLQSNETTAELAFQSGKERSTIVAQQQARQVLNNTVQDITNSVRKVAGNRIANVFDPFARTVVGGTLGRVVAPLPQGSKARTTTAQPSQLAPNAIPQQTQLAVTQAGVAPEMQSQVVPYKTAVGPIETFAPQEQLLGQVNQPSAAQTTVPSGQAPVAPLALFALELQTFLDGTEAYTLMNNLKSQGYSATYIVRSFDKGQLYFKVRVGDFASYSDANQARQVLAMPARIVLVGPEESILTH